MSQKTILVVDDNEFDRNILSNLITRRLNHKVLQASSGAEALQVLKAMPTSEIDLILLDIEMPELSGEDFLSEVRKDKNFDRLPVVMVSGNIIDDTIVRCLKAGANDFITKPLRFEVTASRIENQLKLGDFFSLQLQMESIQAIRAMVTTYNHEINTPLTVAFIMLANLKKNRQDDIALQKVKESLERITDIVKKVKTLIREEKLDYEKYSDNSQILKLK
jgi:CheY-like chemotaxis protein